MNTFGTLYRFTEFGESHGPAIGGVIDGLPAGVVIDTDYIQSQLDRRRPGTSAANTARNEADRVEFLSGILDGKSTGTPIGFLIRNTNQHSSDYDRLKEAFRPSHADYTYTAKYGLRDWRGGGRASARETACRVVAGAVATLALRQVLPGFSLSAKILQVGEATQDFEQAILAVKAEGDTIGGIIGCNIQGVPAGLGDPIFGKLQAKLAAAMLSINAAKGFDYGSGFEGVALRGSQLNDPFENRDGRIRTRTNHSGGIQGGISNGEEIYFRVVFKPIATLAREQDTVDAGGNPIRLAVHGRHDTSVLLRAVPVVESMAAMVILDAWLLNRNARIQ
ncbi:MAG: chorismate synthase [Paludibacteraceae bacterium]|nr:chorismate synthase [Paludibacteraceae bacterium]